MRSSSGVDCSSDLLCLVQLEMILQASEYEAAQGLDLKEFFTSTAGKFKTDIGKAWAAEIVARREAKGEGQTLAGLELCLTAYRRCNLA